MTDSGFRPYPGKEIGKKWVDMGGLWQSLDECVFRPIHPAHGWNHYPWMWQVLTGEDMTPTGEGWYWWRLDDSHPWSIGVVLHIDSFGLMLASRGGGLYEVSHCRFGGPVYGMPGEVGG